MKTTGEDSAGSDDGSSSSDGEDQTIKEKEAIQENDVNKPISTSQTPLPANPVGPLSQSSDQLANNPPMVPESGTSKAPKGDNEEGQLLEIEKTSSG